MKSKPCPECDGDGGCELYGNSQLPTWWKCTACDGTGHYRPPPSCPIHATPLICPHCTGAQGGKAKTDKKAAAARANGAKGGRPKRPLTEGKSKS